MTSEIHPYMIQNINISLLCNPFLYHQTNTKRHFLQCKGKIEISYCYNRVTNIIVKNINIMKQNVTYLHTKKYEYTFKNRFPRHFTFQCFSFVLLALCFIYLLLHCQIVLQEVSGNIRLGS